MLIAIVAVLLQTAAPVDAVADGAPAVAAEPQLTADQIVALVVRRIETNKVAREGISYTKLIDKGAGEGETAHMWIRNGEVWQRVLVRDGEPVRKPKDELRPQFDFTAGLNLRYNLELADPPIAEVDGHRCWALKFSPRGQMGANGIVEEVANRMSGTFWFDAQGFWLRRAEGHLTEGSSFRSYLIGVIKDVQFSLTQTEVLGAIMPEQMQFNLHVGVGIWKLDKDIRRVWTYRYSDWSMEPAPDTATRPQ